MNIALLLVLQTAQAAEPNLLMVGNSYTGRNNLAVMLAEQLTQEVPGYSSVMPVAMSPGGYTLSQHLADADGSRGDTPLRQALVTGTVEWSTVFLQEQSQTAGFPQSDGAYQASHAGALGLDALVAQKGAQTVFYMTWGRRDGDNQNPSLYPDFNTMQDRLAEGYLAYVDDTSTEQRPVYLAPAGFAFRTVWQDTLDAGQTPTDPGTPFYDLYSGDGSHPSIQGSYLISSTLMATLTGRRASTLASLTAMGVPESEQLALADAANRTVLDDPLGDLDYPWVFPWSEWSGDIADDVLRPLVWLDSPATSLSLDVAARLWIEPGGRLEVGALTVLDGGVLQQRGDVFAESVTLEGDGSWRVEAGTLQASQWMGDLSILPSATLVIADSMTVSGAASLAGRLSYEGATTGGLAILSAGSIALTEIDWDLPEGVSAQVEDRDGGQVLVLVSVGGATMAEEDSSTGCRCAVSTGGAGWWPLLLLWGVRQRRFGPSR